MVPSCENEVQVNSAPQQGLSSWSWWVRRERGDTLCCRERESRTKAPNSGRELRAVISEDLRVFLQFKIWCW